MHRWIFPTISKYQANSLVYAAGKDELDYIWFQVTRTWKAGRIITNTAPSI